MRVEPELRDHPKFLRLKKIVGEGAMEFLLALWGHCQSNQRGEFWTGADADYVEMICRWDGEAGVLFKALTDCGKPGFLVVEEKGVRVHDWEDMNANTVANWFKNRQGRRGKKPAENPQVPPQQTPAGDGSKGGSGRSRKDTADNPQLIPQVPPQESSGEPATLSVFHSFTPSGPTATSDDYKTAERLVGVLNALTGATFSPTLMQQGEIVQRLLEVDRDAAGIEKMLRRQTALWKAEAKTRQWLKPGTLFGPNFHDYYGQRELPVTNTGGETVTKTGRPRGEVLQALELATDPQEIAALREELKTAG